MLHSKMDKEKDFAKATHAIQKRASDSPELVEGGGTYVSTFYNKILQL